MTLQTLFSSTLMDNVAAFSVVDTLLSMSFALVVGLFIFYVYKKTFKGVMYSSSFATALIALTMITTVLILAVTTNVALSLGMVGALSIVRFRTAIKEPLDIAYLFWSIGTGILLGAGMLPLALCGAVIIGVILLVFSNRKPGDNPYLLIVTCEDDVAERAAFEQLHTNIGKYVIKSKTISPVGIEFTVEVRLANLSTQFVNDMVLIEGITGAVLVSYNGDYMA